MQKWIVLGLTALCSFSSLANNHIPEIDQLGNRNNPAKMGYYVQHYKKPESKEYRDLLIGVRVAADSINFYTRRLDDSNARLDYCLPMKDPANRESLNNWKTEDLMAVLNNYIEHKPAFKKYGTLSGSIASYLASALKAEYPCSVQRQW